MYFKIFIFLEIAEQARQRRQAGGSSPTDLSDMESDKEDDRDPDYVLSKEEKQAAQESTPDSGEEDAREDLVVPLKARKVRRKVISRRQHKKVEGVVVWPAIAWGQVIAPGSPDGRERRRDE